MSDKSVYRKHKQSKKYSGQIETTFIETRNDWKHANVEPVNYSFFSSLFHNILRELEVQS